MVTTSEWTTIQNLLKADLSVPQVALRLGRSTTTIYKLIKNSGPKSRQKNTYNVPIDLEQFVTYINKSVQSGVTNAKKIFYELENQGYQGRYPKVNRYVRSQVNNRRYRKYKPSKRFETDPGQQAQLDWGHCGKIEINGKRENLYCFSYILGYSRMRYLEFAVRQNIPTLVGCHLHAFEKLGIPKEIVYDNMATVVSKIFRLPDGSFERQLTSVMADLAKHFGYKIEPTAPYWPRAKGKVERSIKYIKGNFMQGIRIGKGMKSLEIINEKGKIWLDTIANAKPNGTTREIPSERYIKEKAELLFPYQFPPYNTFGFSQRFSGKDASVEFKSCSYPVPEKFARRTLLVKELNEHGVSLIEIYDSETMIAKYYVSSERYRWVSENEAIFFKEKKEFKDKAEHKIKRKRPGNTWPKITPRPISYYNDLILKD